LRQGGVRQAKTQLSELLRAVEGGQEVEILRGGRPVARLVSVSIGVRRQLGIDEGKLLIDADFDAPLPPGAAQL
jgi:prevent-host-death family protein